MALTLLSLAFIANLLLVAARSMGNKRLVQATATSSEADIFLFDKSGVLCHSFHLTFNEDVGEVRYCEAKEGEICLEWSKSAKLTVRKSAKDGRVSVHASAQDPFGLCFNLKGQHLYGGPIVNKYPAERSNISNLPYITGDMSRFGSVSAVMERYWYSSSGLNLQVDPSSPIFVTQQEEQLCLAVKNEYPYKYPSPLQLRYETCPDRKNLREAIKCFFEKYDKPIPPENVIGSPIWSTWVEFKTDISQEKAIKFFNDIKSHDFKLSVMEIDDAWETYYGSQEFDKSKFPDPKAMVDKFHSEGYLATLWVHPFIGPGCPSLDKYVPYLTKLPNGSIGLTKWWNGVGAYINFLDPTVVEWYQDRLVNIQNSYGFDSFKFDAGEAAYIPGLGKDERSLRLRQPNQFTTNYVKAASKFGPLAEVRVGAEAHDFQLIQRIQDTNSVWDAENWGLRSVLLSVLQLSLHGYGAVLTDMVGGNCYGNRPSKELFIRWTQLSTFLPLMQFSLTPWSFDKETVDITRNFTNLHYKYKDRFLKEFKDSSHPIVNPIWWIAHEDPIAQTIDSEFLLGENLLVAPVLEEGAVSRDIYFPTGKWKDQNTGVVYSGPGYAKNYKAPLHILPYFEKVHQ